MPDTVQAVGIFLLAILPGALYTWAFEREVGRWGIGLSDRVLRFVAGSAIFQALYAWPLYALRNEYWSHRSTGDGKVVYQNLIERGQHLPAWLFLVPLGYVAVPIVAGTVASHAVKKARLNKNGT